MCVRPSRSGIAIAAVALGFLGLAALVMAGAAFPPVSFPPGSFPPGSFPPVSFPPGAFPVRPGDALDRRTAPADRLEAAAPDIAVIDASTLRLARRVVRLAGIAAPGRGETCLGQGAVGGAIAGFDCGTAAAAALAALVRERNIACEMRDTDAMGRPLAICTAGGTELNRALVAGGWARVDGAAGLPASQAEDLRNAEKLARAEHRGLWVQSTIPEGVGNNGRKATW